MTGGTEAEPHPGVRRSGAFEVADSPGAVRDARAFVRARCVELGLDDTISYRASLLTSETVTNALRHGGGRACVRVAASSTGVLVEVEDRRAGRLPRTAAGLRPDVRSVGGRGLFILSELSTDWGSYDRGGGKVVWFHLAGD